MEKDKEKTEGQVAKEDENKKNASEDSKNN